MWTGGGAAFVGDRRRSLRALDRAIALARERGVLGLPPHALGLRGNLAIWMGACRRPAPTPTRPSAWPMTSVPRTPARCRSRRSPG